MSRVAARFGRAAGTYAHATAVQRQVAAALADRIASSGLASGARVAEFGCGTGYLPLALWPRLRPGLWVATDIAPAMASMARRALPPQAAVAVMDAERPALTPGFDLVCSSLTLQWLHDPAAAVAGWRALARPGGVLAVATLLEGTFAEWRTALAEAGVEPPAPAFPTLEAATAWFDRGAWTQTLTLTERHAGALAFLRAARESGIDASDSRPLDAGVMRKAARALEARGSAITYRVLLAVESPPATVRVEPA